MAASPINHLRPKIPLQFRKERLPPNDVTPNAHDPILGEAIAAVGCDRDALVIALTGKERLIAMDGLGK